MNQRPAPDRAGTPAARVSMAGKTVLVTGATSGIGREAALGLARLGARVAIVGRDAGRLDATEQALREVGAEVERFTADLSSQASIRALADEVEKRLPRLDVLVNNAGGLFQTQRKTADGIEWTFAVNHLAYYLLTRLLLEHLERSAPARVVSVASYAHTFASVDPATWPDDWARERSWSPWRAYTGSKLCNILFTFALARRLAGKGVTANCLHPGTVRTGFGRNDPGLFKAMILVGRPFFLSPRRGARTTIYLASSPEVEGVSGKYFARSREARPKRIAFDEALQERLWADSARMVGLPAG